MTNANISYTQSGILMQKVRKTLKELNKLEINEIQTPITTARKTPRWKLYGVSKDAAFTQKRTVPH